MAASLGSRKPSDKTLQRWMDQFHRDGFLVVPNVLSHERCYQLREELKARESKESMGGRSFAKRMFEENGANLDLFDLEPMVSFAEQLIGRCNRITKDNAIATKDAGQSANSVHVIHNNSFVTPPQSEGLGMSQWHQDDTPHVLSLDGRPLKNVRVNVLAFTVNYYLTDVLKAENGPTEAIRGSHLFGRICEGDISGLENKVASCLGPMGTAVCFNNQVWHRGAPNRSKTPRIITQITYGKRLVGHKHYPIMNYQVPEPCLEEAKSRRRRLLGFLPEGPYS